MYESRILNSATQKAMLDCEENVWRVKYVFPQAMRTQTEMELRVFKENEYVYHSMREAVLSNKHMSTRLVKSK